MNHPSILLRIVLSAWLGLAGIALGADPGMVEGEADLARRLQAQGVILPLEQVVRRARDGHPGTLIDAQLHYESSHGHYVYELHLLDPGGTLWEVELDARTGDLVELAPKGAH